jgi:hypothetical protein
MKWISLSSHPSRLPWTWVSCPIPLVSHERSCLWSEAATLGAAACPICRRQGVVGQRPRARTLHHVTSVLTGVSFMMLLSGAASPYLVGL